MEIPADGHLWSFSTYLICTINQITASPRKNYLDHVYEKSETLKFEQLLVLL